MSGPADAASNVNEPGRFARLAQAAKNHPMLAVASALGSLGTFAAGTAAVAGLFGAGGSGAIGESISPGDLGLPEELSYSYKQVSDDEGRISVQVPVGWKVLGEGWHAHELPPIAEDKLLGPGMNALPATSEVEKINLASNANVGDSSPRLELVTSLDDWKTDQRTPGVFIGASEEILRTHSPSDVLDNIVFRDCVIWAREAYTKGPFAGEVLTWNCPDAQWRLLAATPKDPPRYLVYVQVKLVSTADVEAYNKILTTFEVDFDP